MTAKKPDRSPNKMITIKRKMPEGPECKVIMRNISDMLKGKTLIAVTVKENFLKKSKNMDQLVLPQLVCDVQCKGKFGYITLEDGTAIGFGFGMTGNIRIEPDDAYLKAYEETREKFTKHNKVKFEYQDIDGTLGCFHYTSIRNFGFVNFLTMQELGKKLSTLGPCILSPDVLERNLLLARWKKYARKNICQVLLDQAPIAGIGNYIKAEILYSCKVNPLALIRDLDDDILYHLYLAARAIAHEAYEDDEANTDLHGGKSSFKLKVYNRNVDPFGNKVETLATPDKRTTHWVPAVQTKKEKEKERIKITIKKLNQEPIPAPESIS